MSSDAYSASTASTASIQHAQCIQCKQSIVNKSKTYSFHNKEFCSPRCRINYKMILKGESKEKKGAPRASGAQQTCPICHEQGTDAKKKRLTYVCKNNHRWLVAVPPPWNPNLIENKCGYKRH